MFVRVKKIGAYEYLYLVENAREGGRHVQRVIKALGRRDEVEASGLIDGLIASAARHSRRSIVLSSFYRGDLPELHRLSIGPDLVFGRLWAETGCRDVLKSLVAERRFSFDVERAVYLAVLHRLMISGSDRHADDWCSRVRVPGAEGLDLDHAYKAMAWLGAVDTAGRSTAETVEEALYRQRQPLFGAVSIAFFDTTSLWFEGAGGESLGQRGHSKDYRGHLKQVVLGIVLDDADRPIASFLMPGNTADVTLLLPVVKRLRERFGIQEACIVADRGMISADTMAVLEAEKIQYILGVRERTSREVRTEIIEDGSDIARMSRGMYRANRHQSPFCIVSQAPRAFSRLFSEVREIQVPLVLSYSPFIANSTARPRVMTIDDLSSLARTFFKRVEITSAGRISHSKLNSTKFNTNSSYNAELILLCT